jgi:uncharacterized protein
MMKYLLVVLVVSIAFWIWRKDHRSVTRERSRDSNPKGSGSGGVQTMVQCPVCKLHLAQTDAVTGRAALYCSAAHRDQAEG